MIAKKKEHRGPSKTLLGGGLVGYPERQKNKENTSEKSSREGEKKRSLPPRGKGRTAFLYEKVHQTSTGELTNCLGRGDSPVVVRSRPV